nr:MFS transporter [Actinomycetales bacterium]
MTNPTPARLHRRHLATVAGAACLMVAGNFVFFGITILLPELATALGAELSQVMLYPSLQALAGVFAMSLLAPRLYRAIGVRAAIVAGAIWMVATLALSGVVDNLPLLYLAGFASGITYGLVTTMAASLLINTWFEERRGTMMGAVFAIAGFGGIAAGLVMPAVVEGWGHQVGFFVLAAVLALLVILPGIFIIRSSPGDVGLLPFGASTEGQLTAAGGVPLPRVIPGVPAGRAFRSAHFLALAAAIVGFGIANSIQQHFPALFVERGVTLAVAGTLMSLMALTTVFTNIAIGTINDRRGTLTAVLIALAAQAAALLTFAAASGFLPLAAGTVAFAIGMSFSSVLLPITVMQLFGPRDYAAILGPAMSTLPAGMAIGAPLWGAVASSSGSYALPLLISAGVSACSALLVAWAIRTAPAFR